MQLPHDTTYIRSQIVSDRSKTQKHPLAVTLRTDRQNPSRTSGSILYLRIDLRTVENRNRTAAIVCIRNAAQNDLRCSLDITNPVNGRLGILLLRIKRYTR